MKRHYLLFLALLPLIGWAHEDTLRLSLDDCIMMARRQSIDAAVALGELRSAYWQWRSYRADLLPEVRPTARCRSCATTTSDWMEQ